MQILVISDTHGSYEALRDTLLSHRNADMAIHCGDGEYELERFLYEFPELKPWIHQVRGNCDHDTHIPMMKEIPLPYGHKAVVIHGHRHMGGDAKQNLADLAREHDADMVIFGHLHARIDITYDGIRMFNPGSAAMPRDSQPPSFGLIDVMESGILTSHGNVTHPSVNDMQDD